MERERIKFRQINKRKFYSCTNKKRYRTANEAEKQNKHIARVFAKSGEEAKKMRVYYCEFCDGYHLTSHIRREAI